MRSYLTGSVGNECIVILDLAGLGIQHIRQGTPSKIVQYFDFFLVWNSVSLVLIECYSHINLSTFLFIRTIFQSELQESTCSTCAPLESFSYPCANDV